MKGCIVARGNSFRLAVSLGKNAQTGKYDYYFENIKTTEKAVAQKRLRQILTELDKGAFVKPDRATLAEYLKTWLSDYCKPNLSPRTLELYTYICDKHIIPAIGKIPLAKVKPQEIQKLYADKLSSGLSSRTVQIIHVALNKSLKNAVKIGLLARNPVDLTESSKPGHSEIRVMNEADLSQFLEAAKNTPYHALFYTALFTGMRRAELLALRWLDIDLLLCQLSVTRSMQQLHNVPTEDRISFKEPKTASSRRMISLSPNTTIMLREHKAQQTALKQSLDLAPLTENDLVFCQMDGKPYLPDSISHCWMKLARRTGLAGIRLHDARHTHASLLLKAGTHPKIVQERLGHASITTTLDIYSHVAPGMQALAAASLDSILPKENRLDKELKELIQN